MKKFIPLIITFTILYLVVFSILKLILPESATLTIPGWHTTVYAVDEISNYVTISALVIAGLGIAVHSGLNKVLRTVN